MDHEYTVTTADGEREYYHSRQRALDRGYQLARKGNTVQVRDPQGQLIWHNEMNESDYLERLSKGK